MNHAPSRPIEIAADFDDDLLESAVEEYTLRLRAGEFPTVDEYATRHPQLAALLNDLLPTIAAVERAKNGPEVWPAPSLPREKMPEQIGDFRIVREIGFGGMGIVYEAVQESLGRRVALKLLPGQMLLDPKRVAHFEQEARIAAQLHHTNIVPVFGVGHTDGLYYYVMQLIDGEGLDRKLAAASATLPRQARWPTPQQAAAIGRDVARALHSAHEQGTLHRDVKPANILIDSTGHVWLTDFGLARVLESEATATAQLNGTLRYMPPERFQGKSDARGDVYSLGVTLFELISGRSPFEAKTTVELMRQITQTELPRLSTIAPRVPRDLETIVAKATARESHGRYATAADLADDLQRFIDGTPIQARRIWAIERGWRWCRRNRLTAAASALALASVVTLAVVSAVGYWQTKRLNNDLTQSLGNERASRETAEATSTIALEALDKVFARFTPAGAMSATLDSGDNWGGVSARTLSAPTPAVSPQIAAALEDLLPYYLRLAEQRENDPRVRREAAAALQRIGLIHARLGRFAEAQTAWDRAAGLLSDADDQPARKVETTTQLAALRSDQGDVERCEGRFTESRTAYEQAREALVAVPDDLRTFESRRELARAELSLSYRDGLPTGISKGNPPGPGLPGSGPPPEFGGPPFDDFGGPPGADRPPPHPRGPQFGRPEDRGPPPRGPFGEGPPGGDPFGGGLPSSGPPFAGPPLDEQPGEGLPGAHHGDVLGLRTHLDAAYALLTALIAERPDDPPTRLLMARCRVELAKHGPSGRVDLDSPDLAEAVRLLRGLRDEFPDTPDFAYALSTALADFHPRDVPDEKLAGAEARLRESLTIADGLVRDHPQAIPFALDQVQIVHRWAEILARQSKLADAETQYRRAISLQTQAVAQLPASATRAMWQARLQCHLADLLIRDERVDEAGPLLASASAAIEPYARLGNATPEVRELSAELRRLSERVPRSQR